MLRHPEMSIGQVNQTSGVIRVEMRQYNLPDIPGADTKLTELGTDLLIRVH